MGTTALDTGVDFGKYAFVYKWTGIPNGNQGAVISMPGFQANLVQVSGTFGAGGSVQLEGSLDNATWVILTDAAGANIVFTSAAIKTVSLTGLAPYIRPNVTAGDGTTSLTVRLYMTNPYRG